MSLAYFCLKKSNDYYITFSINNIQGHSVHAYLQTATDGCKFGIDLNQLDIIITELRQTEWLDVLGIHCHIGSTITNVQLYRYIYNNISNRYQILSLLHLLGNSSISRRVNKVCEKMTSVLSTINDIC